LKKPKTLETKLRSAIRLIWSRSAERRAILKASIDESAKGPDKYFNCPICGHAWPVQLAEVDHEPPIGSLERWQDVGEFINKMFFGPQRAICKLCHKKKTAEQRRKK
jgi:transcription elongation factor Elf1